MDVYEGVEKGRGVNGSVARLLPKTVTELCMCLWFDFYLLTVTEPSGMVFWVQLTVHLFWCFFGFLPN